MATPQKDTIYIDVDDEITSIIEKVQSSSSKVIALVLPKRATVFQSIVNMKLLKRSAATAKKNIVLITSEASLLPLAGAVGVHVAKTLQSKPEIPEAPIVSDAPVSVDDPSDDVGVPAAAAVNDDSTIEVDNDAPVEIDPEPVAKTPTQKLAKKLKVPDFNKFRVRLILGVALLILLVAGWFAAFVVMPKAQVVIKTNDTTVNSNLTLTASSTVKQLDDAKMIVPAEKKEFKKTDTQKVTATGQKDEGTKASGKATLSLSDCSQDQVSLPAGTQLSAGGATFVTQADVLLKRVLIGSSCRNADFPDFSTATVAVVAKDAGDKYNLSARNYAVSGFSNVAASGTAMAGGTSKIVTVVNQSDIDGAKQKILDANGSTAAQTLAGQLKTDGYLPLNDTFVNGDPLVAATPNVGDEASDVTVNVTITYAMMGMQQGAVQQLLEKDIKQHIDTAKQSILDNGLTKAATHVSNKATNGDLTVAVQTTAVAGVRQDVSDIKKAIAGKKKGDVQSLLLARPGVKDVTVTYSPFWVYSTPSSVNKITVVFQKSDGSTTSGQ